LVLPLALQFATQRLRLICRFFEIFNLATTIFNLATIDK
jgi:hypothetical protein